MGMRIKRRRNGSIVLSLSQEEALLLRALPERLRTLLQNPDFKRRVAERLFPCAYQSRKDEEEYRRLLGQDLQQRKLASVEAFEKSLDDCKLRSRRKIDVNIEPEVFELWLGFVNDMRLFLGTELDIRDESWGGEFDPYHPQAEDMLLLHYLSWLEESLLRAQGFPGFDEIPEAPEA